MTQLHGHGEDAAASIIDCFEKISVSLQPYLPLDALSPQDPLSVELRGCITTYVNAIRLETPPETALSGLKSMMREHLHLGDESSVRAIADDVTRWTIVAYFPNDRPASP